MSAPESAIRVSYDDLSAFIERSFEACGMSQEHARTMGELMARADLGGQDGHGVVRLPNYIKRIRAGGMEANPTIRTIRERAATALIDGGNGPGHLVMSHAADLAMEKAMTTGVAWVGARRSNHAGPAFLYAMMPLKRDMIGLYVAVGSANHMPPWGGTAMLLSTNPIAVAVPSSEEVPVVVDMATTVAAYGKVKSYLDRGEMMPEGWMIDPQGRPLTDPAKASEGFLLPIGGPKGYGLALIFGLLAGTLNGAAFGKDVIDFNKDATSVTNTGHFIVALHIEAFADVDAFKKDVDEIWKQMKGSARLPGVDAIRIPGERLAKTQASYLVQGIPISAPVLKRVNTLATDLGVTPLT